MMKSYNEKETAILRGVISLVRKNPDIYQIKVADIAVAAGIGKGTVYEYFSSKEEILANALVFNVRQGIEKLQAVIGTQTVFEGKYFGLLDTLDTLADHGIPVLRMLSIGGRDTPLKEYVCEEGLPKELGDQIAGLLDDILAAAARGGMKEEYVGSYYGRTALFSSVLGYCVYIGGAKKLEGNQVSIAQAKQNAYKMALNALEMA